MPPLHLMDLSLVDLCTEIQSGRATPTQAVSACFERIHELNPTLNALIFLCEDDARAVAAEQTRRIADGDKTLGVLAGVPFAVKDLEDAVGLPTSYGTKVYKNTNIANEDSPQVARLKAAGAIVVGKTNTPVFGSTMFCKNLAFGATGNPWKVERTSGGSSGGSAAAVAARMMPIATAADGGGSIRIPACFCGAFGLKPTFGLVPMTEGRQFGMLKFIDCVHFGPITRTVEDAALFLDVVSGYHPQDPKSLPKPRASFLTTLRQEAQSALTIQSDRHVSSPSRAVRIRWSADLGYVQKVGADVLGRCKDAMEVFRTDLHCEVSEGGVVLPDMGRSWGIAMGLQEMSMLEGSAVAENTEDVERWFTRAWPRMAKLPAASVMGQVHREGHALNEALGKLFEEVDILATPCLPLDAFSANGPMPSSVDGETLNNPMHIVGFMYPFNFSGHPACVIRTGFTDDGLPLGIQLVAERHCDALLLRVAAAYDKVAEPFGSWPSPSEILDSGGTSKSKL